MIFNLTFFPCFLLSFVMMCLQPFALFYFTNHCPMHPSCLPCVICFLIVFVLYCFAFISLSLLSTQSVIDEVLLTNLCHWIFLKSKCWYINRELLMSSLLYMLSQVLGFNLKGCSSISQVLDLLLRDHQFECNMLENNINYTLRPRQTV